MGFFSILKLSLHSLFNNKLRTLLTITVISVVAFVIVFLFGIGYSLYSSINVNVSNVFNKEGETIRLSSEYKRDNFSEEKPLSIEDIDLLIDKLDIDKGYITYISFFEVNRDYGYLNGTAINLNDSNTNRNFNAYPFYENSNPFIGMENYLVSGRMWNSADKASYNIWMDESYMRYYSIGDTVDIAHTYYTDFGDYATDDIGKFTVTGFIELPLSNSYNENRVFIPYDFFNDTVEITDDYHKMYDKKVIHNMYAFMIPQEGEFYGIEAQNYFSDMVDSISGLKLTYGNAKAYGNITSMLDIVMILTLVIMGLAAFISLIIILLSIGSVANTIKISAEQNRRFFGMMKAIGMKNKSLRSILIGQIMIMVLVGTGIAYGASILLINSAYSVIESLVNSMFFGMSTDIICVISPIIPVCVAAVFIGFVLLFTRTSLKQISNMDVITVINEVN